MNAKPLANPLQVMALLQLVQTIPCMMASDSFDDPMTANALWAPFSTRE